MDWTIILVRTKSSGERVTAVRVWARTCTPSGLRGLGSWWMGRKESVFEGRNMAERAERKSGWRVEKDMSKMDDVRVPFQSPERPS